MYRRLRYQLRLALCVSHLLLICALLAVWARSYHSADYVVVRYDQRNLVNDMFQRSVGYTAAVITDYGEMFLWWDHATSHAETTPVPLSEAISVDHHSAIAHLDNALPRGWNVYREKPDPRDLCSGKVLRIGFPIWWLVAAFIAVGVLCLRRKCAHPAFNICTACGYDLRATPDRCPECGTIPTRK